jgi:hypothetical protein
MTLTTRTLSAATLISLLAATAALVAGPLSPPAGPVASTYKTLAEVQPQTPIQSLPGSQVAQYVITQPGSYYLTASITGVASKSGIQVLANDVSIDLNGFELDGAGVGLAAILASGDTGHLSGLSVRNGVAANWISAGIYAPGCTGGLFESLRLRSTGESGIRTAGGSVVRSCSFQDGQVGVVAETGAHIVDCASTDPSNCGFILGDGSSAAQCSAFGPGVAGFRAQGNNASIIDCVSRGGAVGIKLASGGNLVRRCKVGQTPSGIESDFANTIIDNTVNADTAGQGNGISLIYGQNRVEGNHVYAFDTGIKLYSATTNVVTSNTMHTCTHPVSTGSYPMVAPVVTTAAALATNPKANIAQ